MTNQSMFPTFKRNIFLIKIFGNAALRIHKKEKKTIPCVYVMQVSYFYSKTQFDILSIIINGTAP